MLLLNVDNIECMYIVLGALICRFERLYRNASDPLRANSGYVGGVIAQAMALSGKLYLSSSKTQLSRGYK